MGGMEGRLNKATNDLRSSVTGQLDQPLESTGDLNGRVTATEKRLVDVETKLERRLEAGLREMGLPRSVGEPQDTSGDSSRALSYAVCICCTGACAGT